MTIKKKIFIINGLMVLISLILVLVVGSLLIIDFKKIYMMEEFKKSKIDSSIFKVEKEIYNINKTNANWNDISVKFNTLGYKMYVKSDIKQTFSNLTSKEMKILAHIDQEDIGPNEKSVYFFNKSLILRTVLQINNKNYNIVLIGANKESFKENAIADEKEELEELKFILLSFVVIGISTLLVILMISQLFTKRLVKYIMKPINKLIIGSKRIEEGNFEELINYKGDLEFEQVCNSFDKMQISLKEEKEKNLAYENSRVNMISGISHDLRTPLTAVKGCIKGLKDGIITTKEKQNQYLDIAYKKTCEIDSLLQRLFYFSKLETGKMPFVFSEMNMSNFIEDYITSLKEEQEYENTQFFYSKNANISNISADISQIIRVFRNITENSLKYANVNPLIIKFSLEETEEYQIITISDNGIGVEKSKLDKLFDQFYRADESRNTKDIEGNGLGLYISKYIVEAHGGKINAENYPAFSVIIFLPTRKEDNENINS